MQIEDKLILGLVEVYLLGKKKKKTLKQQLFFSKEIFHAFLEVSINKRQNHLQTTIQKTSFTNCTFLEARKTLLGDVASSDHFLLFP